MNTHYESRLGKHFTGAPILRAPESPPMPLPGLSAFPRTFALRREAPQIKIDGDQERTC